MQVAIDTLFPFRYRQKPSAAEGGLVLDPDATPQASWNQRRPAAQLAAAVTRLSEALDRRQL